MIAQVETWLQLIQVSPSRRAVSEGTTGMVFPKEEKKAGGPAAGVEHTVRLQMF